MKRLKSIGRLLGLALILMLLLTASLQQAHGLDSGTSEINFPADKSLGTVNIEVIKDYPPYWKSTRPHLGKAQGTVKYPTGSKLQVIANYAVSENPALLASLNHKDIVALQLTSLPVDTAFVSRLKTFKNLRKLRLDETDIDDAVFKELAAMPWLEDLNLSKTMLKGNGLKSLTALKKLNTLTLNHVQLDPRNYSQLSALTTLRCLDLANCGIDDHCLQSVRPLTGLVELRVNANPAVTDQGLAIIKDMTRLRDVDLSETKITHKAVMGLRWPDLKVLAVKHLILSQSERKEFKKNSPHAWIKTSSVGDRRDAVPVEIFDPLH